MTLLLISFVAGLLTVLAPCVLPLLPVIIGSSVGARSKATPYIVIGSLALSILVFTYLLKASTAFIDIPPYVWGYLSGGILFGFGLTLLFPTLWEHLPFVSKGGVGANKLLGVGYQKKSIWGDVLMGAALGPVFSTCSPTYFVILATVLPASFLLGTVYLLAYLLGLVIVLILIALLGQRITARLSGASDSRGWFKRALGALFILLGILIVTGNDKRVESWVLDRGIFDGVLKLEQGLLKNLDATETETEPIAQTLKNTPTITVPRALATNFPDTDWSKADVRIEGAISGGPGKDGIPAIDAPTFIPLASFTRPDAVEAIVLLGKGVVKVYPYNILTWHEIVNDELDGRPVAITFCPLCGSALVFDRTLPNGNVSTFGVSGSLLESNMIMYDRATENLWQQSTGRVLAGSLYPAELTRVPFQLLTMGEIRKNYPTASVLSEKTGHSRDYARNPYAGYETNDRFIFDPSNLDTSFHPKTIMAVFRDNDTTFASPWLVLRDKGVASMKYGGITYTLEVTDKGELTVTDSAGVNHPFYFEMWFSVAVQHGENVQVIQP